MSKYKVLVVGSGGREHAIIHQIKKSSLLGEIFYLGQNAKIEEIAQLAVGVEASNHAQIVGFCQKQKIDLVIIGPEQSLIDGLVDDLQKANILAFGPNRNAARLEGSKAFTKKVCDDYQIPTAKYQAFEEGLAAIRYLDDIGVPCVIKADGIAAGKGVIIAFDKKTAIDAINDIFGGKFGKAGKKLIIEEFLSGVEVSFFAICDGKNAKILGSAGDHKKVGDGDVGANTGGMGTYSPSPFIDKISEVKMMEKFINPTMKAMKEMGSPFVGILFAGIILTKDGPKLLEFNTRFGDPETQVLLPRLKTDLLKLILETARGNLLNQKIEFHDKSAVCVIMATKGYPEAYLKGSEIRNLDVAEKSGDNIIIFHSGTKKDGSRTLANGGRVLGVVALSDDISSAKSDAYKAVDLIDWKEGFCRRDIASGAQIAK
ncbi:MAG: phosphoribosylamine--glycine ligase [Rickettsiales bacterium]|jgi:phosphoribosylamine--glycine ligase